MRIPILFFIVASLVFTPLSRAENDVSCSNDTCDDLASGLVLGMALIGGYIAPIYFLKPSQARNFLGSRIHSLGVGGFIKQSRSIQFTSEFLPVGKTERLGLLTDAQVNRLEQPDDSIFRYGIAATYSLIEDRNQQLIALAGAQLKWRDLPRQTKGAPELGLGYYAKINATTALRALVKYAVFDKESVGDLDLRLLYQTNRASADGLDNLFLSYRYTTGLLDHSNVQLVSLGLMF